MPYSESRDLPGVDVGVETPFGIKNTPSGSERGWNAVDRYASTQGETKREPFKLSDSGGLYLAVMPTGANCGGGSTALMAKRS